MNNKIIEKLLDKPYMYIFLLAFVVYFQTVFFDYTYIDDNEIIIDQYEKLSDIENIGKAFVHDAFFTKEMTLYRPILTVSLILNAQIGATDPYIYHFTNVLIHSLVSCLIFASTLVLSFPYGVEHYIKRFNAEYVPMKIEDLLLELKIFIENTELNHTIFRSDHASNYMVFKGSLGKDKNRFLEELNNALENPDDANLRPEWMRGL